MLDSIDHLIFFAKPLSRAAMVLPRPPKMPAGKQQSHVTVERRRFKISIYTGGAIYHTLL